MSIAYPNVRRAHLKVLRSKATYERRSCANYGCPPHPAIYFDADGVRRCTECHQQV